MNFCAAIGVGPLGLILPELSLRAVTAWVVPVIEAKPEPSPVQRRKALTLETQLLRRRVHEATSRGDTPAAIALTEGVPLAYIAVLLHDHAKRGRRTSEQRVELIRAAEALRERDHLLADIAVMLEVSPGYLSCLMNQ